MQDSKPIIGCVIDKEGRVHPIGGIDDFVALIEQKHPELDDRWENEWKPAGLAFYQEASEWVFENEGWIEMLHQDHVLITAGKPSPAALASMMNVLDQMKPESLTLNSDGKPVKTNDPRMLLTKMGG